MFIVVVIFKIVAFEILQTLHLGTGCDFFVNLVYYC